MPTIEIKLPTVTLPRALANTIEHLPGRQDPEVRRTGVGLGGLRDLVRRIPTPDMSAVEVPSVEIPRIEIPKVDLSKIEVPVAIVERLPSQLAERLPKRRRTRSRLWLLIGAAAIASLAAVVANWGRLQPRLSRLLRTDHDAIETTAGGESSIDWAAPAEAGTIAETQEAPTVAESPTGAVAETPSRTAHDRAPAEPPPAGGDETREPIGVGVLEEQHSNGAVRS